jgi:hypothetical protein
MTTPISSDNPPLSENVIHVPKTSNGWFQLEVKKDGTLVFKPVVL